MTNKGHLIIIGASARAAAQSAIRAGYSPWCIDLFADRDLQAIAPVKRCPRDQWPHGILELMKDAPPGPVLLTGAMENHIDVVRSIAADRGIIGPSIEAMMRVRQSQAMGEACASAFERELSHIPMEFYEHDEMPGLCQTWQRVPWHGRGTWMLMKWITGQRVLIKPLRGAAGQGVRFWSPGAVVKNDEYLQQFVRGTSFSAVYHGLGDRAAMISATEQIIGDKSFGADGFTHVGNIGPLALPGRSLDQMRFTGDAIAHHANIHGIFGVDAVLRRDESAVPAEDPTAYPIEVNPRYTASIEIIEAAIGESVLDFDRTRTRMYPLAPLTTTMRGKANVFAKVTARIGDLYEHFATTDIADVPQVDEMIEKGHPICTVFAEGSTRDECYAGLRAMADQVYTRLQVV